MTHCEVVPPDRRVSAWFRRPPERLLGTSRTLPGMLRPSQPARCDAPPRGSTGQTGSSAAPYSSPVPGTAPSCGPRPWPVPPPQPTPGVSHHRAMPRYPGIPDSPWTTASSPSSREPATSRSCMLAGVATTVLTRPESASTPMCAVRTKNHWVPFPVWCLMADACWSGPSSSQGHGQASHRPARPGGPSGHAPRAVR